MKIKFRFWDKDFKKMIYTGLSNNNKLLISTTGEVFGIDYDYIRYEGEFTGRYPIRFEPNLFTGICDRNGKEIYVGDILLDSASHYEAYYEVCLGDYWNNEGFEECVSGYGFYVKEFKTITASHFTTFKKSPENINHFRTELVKNWEVIGNIYENPELLNANNKP